MVDLVIRIKKAADGSAALACRRADGSVTWQRQEGARGRFFPLHDLTHLAVERVLGYRRAFYGLVADGWELTDFGPPWPRGPLPPEAGVAEMIVGFLDAERAGGAVWSTAEFNAQGTAFFSQRGVEGALALTDDQLRQIRSMRRDLFDRWALLPPGETLALTFRRGAASEWRR